MSEIQTNVGKSIYAIYTKDTSALITINDNNTSYVPNYLLSIVSSNKDIMSNSLDTITISLTNLTDDFKNNIINRYNKYKFYLDKYTLYKEALSTDPTTALDLFQHDIEEQIEAYESKIQYIVDTYPGLFDDPTKPYYNEKSASFIKKYQDKINLLKTKYYINDLFVSNNVSNNILISHMNRLKAKYEGLDDLHILPVVASPSKSLLSRGRHKYGSSSNKEITDRWPSKWVDSLLQYYKNGHFPVQLHTSKLALGKTNKLLFEVGAEDSILNVLYQNIINDTDITFNVAPLDLRNLYNDLVLSTNVDGFGGRYYIRKFKKYLLSNGKINRLNFFNFKYMLVDMHTTRKYVCNSDLIKYNFVKSENMIESILITKYFTKTSYYETEDLDTTGVLVYGIYSNGNSIDITNNVAFYPNTNLLLSDTSINAIYDNGSEIITSGVPITILVQPLIPLSIAVTLDNDKTYRNCVFDPSTMVKSVIATYNDVSFTRNVKDEATYTTSSNTIVATNRVDVTYTKNNTTVTKYRTFNGIEKEIDTIEFASPLFIWEFEDGHNLTDSDWGELLFNLIYFDGTNMIRPYYSVDTVDQSGFTYWVDNDTASKTISKTSKAINFLYTYTSLGTKTITITKPITIATITSIAIQTPPLKTVFAEVPMDLDGIHYDNEIDVIGSSIKVTYSNKTTKFITASTSNVIYGGGYNTQNAVLSGDPSLLAPKMFRLVAVLGSGNEAMLDNKTITSTVCYNKTITLNDDITLYGTFSSINNISAIGSANILALTITIQYNMIHNGDTIMITLNNINRPHILSTHQPSYTYKGPAIADWTRNDKDKNNHSNTLRDIPYIPNTIIITYESLLNNENKISASDQYIRYIYERKTCDVPINVYKISNLLVNMDVSTYVEGDYFNHSSATTPGDQSVMITPLVTCPALIGNDIIDLDPIDYQNPDISYSLKDKLITVSDLCVTFEYKSHIVSKNINVMIVPKFNVHLILFTEEGMLQQDTDMFTVQLNKQLFKDTSIHGTTALIYGSLSNANDNNIKVAVKLKWRATWHHMVKTDHHYSGTCHILSVDNTGVLDSKIISGTRNGSAYENSWWESGTIYLPVNKTGTTVITINQDYSNNRPDGNRDRD